MGQVKIDPKLRTIVKKYLNIDDNYIQYTDDTFKDVSIDWIDDKELDWTSLLKLNILNLWMLSTTITYINWYTLSKETPSKGMFTPIGEYRKKEHSVGPPTCDIHSPFGPPIIKTIEDLNKFLCYDGSYGEKKAIENCLVVLKTYYSYPPFLNKIHLRFSITLTNDSYSVDASVLLPVKQEPNQTCVLRPQNTQIFKTTNPLAVLFDTYSIASFPSILNPNFAFIDTFSDSYCDPTGTIKAVFPNMIDFQNNHTKNPKYWEDDTDHINNIVYGQNLQSMYNNFFYKATNNICPLAVQNGFFIEGKNMPAYDVSAKSLCICDCIKTNQTTNKCKSYCANSFGKFKSNRASILDYIPPNYYYCWSYDKNTCSTNKTPFTTGGSPLLVSNYEDNIPIVGPSEQASIDAHIPKTDPCPGNKWTIYDPHDTSQPKTGCVCKSGGEYSSCTECCEKLVEQYPNTWPDAKNPDCPNCSSGKQTSIWKIVIIISGFIAVVAIILIVVRVAKHYFDK